MSQAYLDLSKNSASGAGISFKIFENRLQITSNVYRMNLAYLKPVKRGFILKHAASVLDVDYVSFKLFDFDMPADCVDKVFIKTIGTEELVLGGAVRREALLSVDEDCDFIALYDIGKDCKKTYLEQVEVDSQELTEFIAEREAVDISKHFDDSKTAVFFTFTNDKNKLKAPKTMHSSADYVCFTNSISTDVSGWTTVKCSLTRQFVCSHPHLLFKGKLLSVWIEPDIVVDCVPSDVQSLLGDVGYLLAPSSRMSNCVYELLRNKYCQLQNFLVLEGFPRDSQLASTSVVAMKHTDKRTKKVLEILYSAMKKNGLQSADFLFNYSVWKAKGNYLTIPESLLEARYFHR